MLGIQRPEQALLGVKVVLPDPEKRRRLIGVMAPPSTTQVSIVGMKVVGKDMRRHDCTARRGVDLIECLLHMLVLGAWHDTGVENITILVENRKYGGVLGWHLCVCVA